MGLADPFGLVGARLDGKYDVEAVVAEGGFGVVYRATHRGLLKPVALKVLKVPPELEGSARKTFLDRFAQEARTIAALDHPAIVRVLDFGASLMPMGEAAPWMILEWLTGTTLDADLEARRGHGGRAPAECLAILRPAFDALAFAHDDGIVHRDMKPENLMLAIDRRGERALRVLDFGIAKLMGDDERASSGHTATRTSQRAFSLFYAAPEQLAGTRTGPWTDVYALALVLTEMLTDSPPYDGDEVSDIYADALSPRRPTPAKRGFDVGSWEPVLARAVAIKPAERYTNAREFLSALESAIPTVVRAPSIAPIASAPQARADTFNQANSARDTTPRGTRTPWTTWAGLAALATLAAVVGTTSYLVASRPRPGIPRSVRQESVPTPRTMPITQVSPEPQHVPARAHESPAEDAGARVSPRASPSSHRPAERATRTRSSTPIEHVPVE